MLRRVFSKQTYNGYHLVSLRGAGEDPTPAGLFRKSGGRVEFGPLPVEDDRPKCRHPTVNKMGQPWGDFILVPVRCQKCIWVYNTPVNGFNCPLCTKAKVNIKALIHGEA